MKKFKNKVSGAEISAMTFTEFVEYGKQNNIHIYNGVPWSFKIAGHPVTHENDKRYLIPTPHLHNNYPFSDFTPDDILMIGIVGELTPVSSKSFYEEYKQIE